MSWTDVGLVILSFLLPPLAVFLKAEEFNKGTFLTDYYSTFNVGHCYIAEVPLLVIAIFCWCLCPATTSLAFPPQRNRSKLRSVKLRGPAILLALLCW